jgi:hypothetical protein
MENNRAIVTECGPESRKRFQGIGEGFQFEHIRAGFDQGINLFAIYFLQRLFGIILALKPEIERSHTPRHKHGAIGRFFRQMDRSFVQKPDIDRDSRPFQSYPVRGKGVRGDGIRSAFHILEMEGANNLVPAFRKQQRFGQRSLAGTVGEHGSHRTVETDNPLVQFFPQTPHSFPCYRNDDFIRNTIEFTPLPDTRNR